MKWIICFKKANNIGTWRLFTAHRPDFGHVFAVRYDPELDLWIRFECASQRFNFELLSEDAADYLAVKVEKWCSVGVSGLPIQPLRGLGTPWRDKDSVMASNLGVSEHEMDNLLQKG